MDIDLQIYLSIYIHRYIYIHTYIHTYIPVGMCCRYLLDSAKALGKKLVYRTCRQIGDIDKRIL